MSVLLMINSEKDIDNLTSWALVFASAMDVDLKIAIVKKSSQISEPKPLTFSLKR